MTATLSSVELSSLPLHERLRGLFPALQRQVQGKPLVYLDSAATALKPATVIEAEADFYRRHAGTVHRGMHLLVAEATREYEAARERVARWIGAPSASGVVFTRCATAGLNLIARGLEHELAEGDEILLTEMEHHANLVPWIMLARRQGVTLRHIPFDTRGELDLSSLSTLLGPRTRVVSLTHTSNVLGTVNPVAEIARRAHRLGALVVVDAAQAVGHRTVDMRALDADLLVFSAHKCYAPTGVGVLAGTAEALHRLEPLEGGGEMILEVQLDRATWAEIPQRFEAGTPNAAGVVGLVAAIDLLDEIGLDVVRRHEQDITAHAIEALQALGGLSLHGPLDATQRGGLISFSDPGLHPHDMSAVLDQHGIAVRAGHHCAQPLHRRLGVAATTRASFGVYSGPDDVAALVEGLRDARRFFAC
ncbi:MAG: SufS family cysteine desulfurase [Pseudomonadota bacterium]